MKLPLLKPSSVNIGFALFIGVFGISTADIFVRLSTQTTGLNGIGLSLFLSASRLIVSSLYKNNKITSEVIEKRESDRRSQNGCGRHFAMP